MVKITNRSNSSGYYYGLPKVGRAQLTRYYYDQSTEPIIQGGGNILGYTFNYFVSLLAPLGKDRLMAVIVLLVMNHFKKFNKQSGGSLNYLAMAEKTLAPLSNNLLIVIGSLLLLDYTIKNKRLIGGSSDKCGFSKKLVQLLKSKYKTSQSGGNLLIELGKIVMPLGINHFKATTLLIMLDRLFKRHSSKLYGGTQLLTVLKETVSPLNMDKFLTTLGLSAFTKQNGGDCGCGGIKSIADIQTGGSQCNCSMAQNYTTDLTQFGSQIPTWGSNLIVEGQGTCL